MIARVNSSHSAQRLGRLATVLFLLLLLLLLAASILACSITSVLRSVAVFGRSLGHDTGRFLAVNSAAHHEAVGQTIFQLPWHTSCKRAVWPERTALESISVTVAFPGDKSSVTQATPFPLCVCFRSRTRFWIRQAPSLGCA